MGKFSMPALSAPVWVSHPFYPNPTSAYLTKLIVISSSFLLGAFYCHWVVDHGTLWQSTATPTAVQRSLSYYAALIKAPTWYASTLSGVGIAAALGCFVKICLNGPSGMLFDGGSLVLLISAASVYTANVLAALEYLPLDKLPAFDPATTFGLGEGHQHVIEALQTIGASHMIIAVSLTGVLALQGAQGWSDRPTKVAGPTPAATPRPASPVVKA